VLTIFGAAALFLVAVGLYGIVAYSVASRTWEIGVRIALGAEPADARRMVMRQGFVLVTVGVAVALPLAWAAMRLLEGFLVGGTANDPVAFLLVALMFALVTLAATWIPARRASRVDPMVALRAE
jgi:ABC-type antimicrobial peptide transport system permease subunit